VTFFKGRLEQTLAKIRSSHSSRRVKYEKQTFAMREAYLRLKRQLRSNAVI
jgi:hypothetical protein